MTASTAQRSTTLQDLVNALTEQHAAQCDLIIPASKIRARGGRLVVTGADPVVDDEGVTDPNGEYDVLDTCDDGIAGKLGVPLAFLRRMRTERPDVWDILMTRLLQGGTVKRQGETTTYPADARVFMLRTFVWPDGRRVARALLSDSYRIVDHLDYLTAVLAGVQASGVEVKVDADLTDRRMYVRLTAPGVHVDASALLAGYRSPFASPDVQRAGRAIESYRGDATNTLIAGLVVKNSEVGDGGYSITPRAVFPVCTNGLTVVGDMLRGVHLGGRQSEGVIKWSEDTKRADLQLITKRTRDAVQQFLSPEYVQATVDRIAADMGVAVAAPDTHIQAVAKTMKFAPEVMQGVLSHFILGGQLTSGGVMQAVTSYAQTVSDADLANELEEMALDVLGTSAALARTAA